jgi:uncharacterized membrane protein YeaQ/YmgE (transglycosylase-associated protein family)
MFRSPAGGTLLLRVAAGCLGALVGGVIFLIFDTAPLQVFTLGGLVVALLGAIAVLGVVQMMMRRLFGTSRDGAHI